MEKGVAERKGHRVIDGPHTLHDVRSEDVEGNKQLQLKVLLYRQQNINVSSGGS